ncbi:hypothetical protein F7725_006852 [Dissostichus mawsoni]|uniref:Uncharacterized protein n=1 Tax=Dissostichus mawsoni TaxID=36200 RepID=A0A7J5XV23_DISMA|nr:hypothetical protein F7725_006852 [Dissostichus mawsoni]
MNQPFSVLNERLRPSSNTRTQLYSSLNRMEDRQMGSLSRRNLFYRPTVVPTEPKASLIQTEPKASLTQTEPEDPEEPESTSEEGDQVSDEGTFADLLKNSFLINELNLSDFGGDEPGDEERSASSSEEEDQPGELNSEGAGDSESVSLDDEGRRPFQRAYINGALPDLINSGRPLSRRRTLGHVTDTLKEVRREVELSRRRSIKLKAQVDKLQESREGPGWSQHREKVTEEVQSILKLLRQLTESESSPPEPPRGTNRLDASLAQLQTVACKLALSHNKHSKSGNGKGSEESAILQQALRDRDDAIEKKKAMEAELLRSKTDLMLLNNQLLEAVQKRLELSLELENWKEDVQQMLHQQLQAQQQAEAQKKPSRLGILRRSKQTTHPAAEQLPHVYARPSHNQLQTNLRPQICCFHGSQHAAPPTPLDGQAEEGEEQPP